MKLKFWGATRTVTGSSHLLTVNNRRVLLDCGLFQGNRKLSRELNQTFAAPPPSIEEVILSHTHIDHCGNLPNLARNGFKGPIHCTGATADLAQILLLDSGKIQESDAAFLNKKAARRGDDPVEPLYTIADAERVLPQFRPYAYDAEVKALGGDVRARFRDAGHVLGSAFVEMEVREDSKTTRLLFSGDLGRRNMPILRDPEIPEPADVLILESTYGSRIHQEYAMAEQELAESVERVIKRGGKIIIPAFSVGRTQEIVYALNNLWNRGKLPRIPVYVDSPLSVNATGIFRAHPECYDDHVLRELQVDKDPFGFEGLLYVKDVEHSKRLNLLQSPCVIISASGMAESGRVLHHLKNNIGDPRNAVFIVGFQAENTLGRRLVEKQPEIKIFGETHQVLAEVKTFNAFSAHADHNELRAFAQAAAIGGNLKRIFLVHGEETGMASLQEALQQDLPGCEVIMPTRGEEFEIA